MYLSAIIFASLSRTHTSSASSCFVPVRRATSAAIGVAESPSSPTNHPWRLLSTKSSDEEIGQQMKIHVSRLSTLQTLLSERGAPGSMGCNQGGGDLVAVSLSSSTSSEYSDLHPHLLPLAKSQSSGHLVCALRQVYADDADYDSPSLSAPWPIVESSPCLPGMRLLSLNSEHLMRRIAADADANLKGAESKEVVDMYNDGLGSGKLAEKSMDNPYEMGSVEQLGYGLNKYVLLRVGPFPDLYETMAKQHLSRSDEESSLIAAEASNRKFIRFGSTFAFYAKLLESLPRRAEECRGAALMTLRLPLPSMGLSRKDFVDVAKLAGFSTDDADDSMAQMLEFYEKMRVHEKEENSGDKTPKQMAMEDANYLLDVACLTGQRYGEVRGKIAEIYRGAGMEEDARFVERC